MNAVITVVGHDTVGVLAKASGICAMHNANILDVTQTVMGQYFSMVMLADISKLNCDFSVLSEDLQSSVREMGLIAHVMHEDIFNAMHRI